MPSDNSNNNVQFPSSGGKSWIGTSGNITVGAGKARGKHSLWRKQNHTQDLEAVREKKKKKEATDKNSESAWRDEK